MLDRTATKTLRCAIYTRKSSEEGLEQDFNSLHAQREACEAYIQSQRHEGWTVVSTAYDDGGYSGGSMERPALRALLNDIADRKIDVVVVYKVDRLTRSLTDFARIVEVFDRQGASFVSVTQQFNTTSSMGRLTLNVLLSFAQFEREVTGERIRDKIAASKKKGLWMGGWVAIGYDKNDRTLSINEPEAEVVRTIFRLYLEFKNVRLVEAELRRLGLRTKAYVTATGRRRGNRPFSRGHIYTILSSPLYLGEIAHKGARYPGQHPAIIDQPTWKAVQAQLATNGHVHQTRANAMEVSLLAGLLVDEHGAKLVASHTKKGSKRYRYYATSPGSDRRHGAEPRDMRVPAADFEEIVVKELIALLRDRRRLAQEFEQRPPRSIQLIDVFETANKFSVDLEHGTSPQRRAVLQRLIRRVVMQPNSASIEFDRDALVCKGREPIPSTQIRTGALVVLKIKMALARRGSHTRFVLKDGMQAPAREAPVALVKAISRGYCWFDDLCSGRFESMREIAIVEGVTERFVAQQMQLSLVAPALIENILAGQIDFHGTTKSLAESRGMPSLWGAQEVALSSNLQAVRGGSGS